jgi:Pregnancy-associated plasma protein-A/Secretion system C-terminal sorting domain
MKHLYSFLFFCLSVSSSYAQRICGTYEYIQARTAATPANKNQSARNNEISRDTVMGEVIIIPVVIHVLYNKTSQNISDAQVFSQLNVLNNDYGKLNADIINVPAAFAPVAADVKIKFCLARIDPQGRSTKGIIRKETREENWLADDAVKFSISGGDDAWDAKRYLNIWVCNLFGRNLGYSSLPGSVPDKDGVVIQYDVFGTSGIVRFPFNKGRTATHEIGHWLGLMHLWGDVVCGDDHIDDTPPQQSYNNGCPSFPHKSNCSINSNGDMFMNFMDFTADGCMNMFTLQQKNKMRSLFAAKGSRNSFLNSMVCDSTLAVMEPLPVDTVTTKQLITVYPNPATSFVMVESNQGDLIGKTTKIFNSFGREIQTQVLTAQKNLIPVYNLAPGIYFIKIEGTEKNSTLKFLKQ